MITNIKLNNITAFGALSISLSSGVNIFLGKNGTGKTHILKILYAACSIDKNKSFAEKLQAVFLPAQDSIGRIIKRVQGGATGNIEITRKTDADKSFKIGLSFNTRTRSAHQAHVTGAHKQWEESISRAVYIPVKDMLANAPGFRSLYNLHKIHFEEIYPDVIDRALLPSLLGKPDKARASLLSILQKGMEGKVVIKNEQFFLKNKQGELEFTLLAEGVRKLALLWLLIQNGTLTKGSVLIWDEPEANLNPLLMKTVVQIILELQRIGVQVFIATHDYVFLREFDLQATGDDTIVFHSLYKDSAGDDICCKTVDLYGNIDPNPIDMAFNSIIERELAREMGDHQ